MSSTVLNLASGAVGLAFATILADSREKRKSSDSVPATASPVIEFEKEETATVFHKDNDAFDVEAAVAEWAVVLYSLLKIVLLTCLRIYT